MPAKRFTGLVGELQQHNYNTYVVRLQEFGLWPIMVEALDRHYFGHGENDSFPCPAPGCEAGFGKAGEWTEHGAELHHREWLTGDRFSILPHQLKFQSKERETILERRNTQIYQQARALLDKWRLATEDEQRELNHIWLEQLAHDEAWDVGTTPEKSKLWRDFAVHGL